MLAGSDERRRYPRSRRSLPLMAEASGPGVLNHVDNISANGVRCHTIKPVPLMTRMQIKLELPGQDHSVDAEGIVVRCDPDVKGDDHFKVAILFTRLDEDDHSAIRRWVEEDLAEQEQAS
jgi:hypothetical protein